MIVWRLVERIPRFVYRADGLMVVRLILGKVVVCGTVLLNQLHVLQFNGVIMLPGQLVIDLVRIVRYVPDLLDVRGDGTIEASLVVRFTENMLLIGDQLVSTLLPQFFGSTGFRPYPSPPIQPLETHNHSTQRFALSILQIIQSNAISIFSHVLATVKLVFHLMADLWELVGVY